MRIVLTRSATQSAPLIASLREQQARYKGIEVVALPLVRLVEARDGGKRLAEAVQQLDDYDWIVFTSANAVKYTFGSRRLKVRGDIAAVGESTAAAVRARGYVVEKTAPEGHADSLVTDFPTSSSFGQVLFPCSAIARDTVTQGLSQKGWSVDAVEAYQTIPTVLDDDNVVKARNADIVVFAASSAVKAFVTNVGSPAPGMTALCIGSQTARTAEDELFDRVIVAVPHNDDGLLKSLRTLIAARQP